MLLFFFFLKPQTTNGTNINIANGENGYNPTVFKKENISLIFVAEAIDRASTMYKSKENPVDFLTSKKQVTAIEIQNKTIKENK